MLQDAGQQLVMVLELAESDLARRLSEHAAKCSREGRHIWEDVEFIRHHWRQMLQVCTLIIACIAGCTHFAWGTTCVAHAASTAQCTA